MARRKNETGGALLLLVAIAVAAVAIVGPLVIAGLAIVAEIKARSLRSVREASELVTAAERDEIHSLESLIAEKTRLLEVVLARGGQEDLPTRGDGMFDERNTQGRRLNRQLETLVAERTRLAALLDALKDRIAERIDRWVSVRSGLIGARSALLVFVAVFSALTISRLSSSGLDVSVSALLFGTGSDGGERVVASALSTLAAGLALWVARSVSRASLA